MKLIFSLYLIIFIQSSYSQTLNIFIQPNNQYVWPCGNQTNPCNDIKTGLLGNENNDVVLNLGGYTYTGVNNTNLSLFNSSVSILGSSNGGWATIDLGNQIGSFINIQEPSEGSVKDTTRLTLNNLIIKNGNSPLNSGIININTNSSSSNLTLNTINISNINGSSVISISTQVDSTTVSINNSSFTNNNATIYYSNSVGSISIINSLVSNNNLTSSNASVFYSVNQKSINIQNNNFTNNSARYYILYLGQSENILIFNTSIVRNTLTDKLLLSKIVYLSQSNPIILNSTIDYNVGGSAVYFNSSGVLTLNYTSISFNSRFRRGSLYIDSLGSLVSFGSGIIYNAGILDGGGIYLGNASSGYFSNGSISKNYIQVSDGGSAVSVMNLLSKLIFNNTAFLSNELDYYTRPIYCNAGNVVLENIVTDVDTGLYTCNKDQAVPCVFTGNYVSDSCSSPYDRPSHSGLSTSKKVGIFFGILLGVGIVGLIVYIVYKRHQNRSKYLSYK